MFTRFARAVFERRLEEDMQRTGIFAQQGKQEVLCIRLRAHLLRVAL